MLDLTSLEKILKEVYAPAIRKQLREEVVLLSHIRRDSENIDASGKNAIVSLMLGYSEAVGARNELELLPESQSTRYERLVIPLKTNYGTIGVSGHAIRQSQSDAGAFARAVDSEMANISIALKKDINRQLFGDGTGLLATVTGVSGNVITVSSTQYLRKTQKIDFYTSAGAFVVSTVITSVNEEESKITVANATGVAATNGIYRKDARNKEMVGLAKIVNTDTYLLNPAEVPEWKANVVVKGSGESLLTAMQRAYTKAEKQAGDPKLIITSYEIRDAYADALTTLRRIVNTVQLNYGFTGIEFNNSAIIPDSICPPGVMYFLNPDYLLISETSDFDWGDEDGKILDKVPGKDAYTAFMYWQSEFSATRRNAHSVLKGL